MLNSAVLAPYMKTNMRILCFCKFAPQSMRQVPAYVSSRVAAAMHRVLCLAVALLACSASQAAAARSLSTLGLLLGHGAAAPCSNNASPVAPLSSSSRWRADLSGSKNIKPNTTGDHLCYVLILLLSCVQWCTTCTSCVWCMWAQ
jgi:hypothetical protein